MTRRDYVKQIWQRSGRVWLVAQPRLAKWAGSPQSKRRTRRRWVEIRNWCAAKAKQHRARGNKIRARKWRKRRRWAGRRVQRLTAQIQAADLPNWLPTKHARQWRKPWTVNPDKAQTFARILWENGRLSPNFTRGEAASKDGQSVPSHLRPNAQRHAFTLERVRHRLGDRSMRALSWYRSPSHNRNVGGATNSRHLYADATDWSDQERIRLGSTPFNNAMFAEFANGGIGTSNGNVRHADNGSARRWTY